MEMPRKPVSRKLRFEILTRDGFTCRYCGRTADATQLQVDHVWPASKDGPTEPWNLITACIDCNQGKRDTPLRHGNLEYSVATCERCFKPIHDPSAAQLIHSHLDDGPWFIVHDSCLDERENPYWISLDELMDIKSVGEWTMHVSGKRWFDRFEWVSALERANRHVPPLGHIDTAYG